MMNEQEPSRWRVPASHDSPGASGRVRLRHPAAQFFLIYPPREKTKTKSTKTRIMIVLGTKSLCHKGLREQCRKNFVSQDNKSAFLAHKRMLCRMRAQGVFSKTVPNSDSGVSVLSAAIIVSQEPL